LRVAAGIGAASGIGVAAGARPAAAEEFLSSGVDLQSWVPPASFPSAPTGCTDIWGYVSPSGREYAVIGFLEGTGFADVTDPVHPIVLPSFIPRVMTIWSDPMVYRDYAYVVNDNSASGAGVGLQVIDLSQIDDGVATLVQSVTTFDTAHDIFVNAESGYLYAVGSDFAANRIGMQVFDLSDPANPAYVACWGCVSGVYIHDVLVVTYSEGPYAGREIAFAAAAGAGLLIIDVTSKDGMAVIGSIQYPGLAYCHQCWLSEDRRYLFIDDELDEIRGNVATTTTYVVDVQDLTNPQFVRSFTNGLPSIDHNLMVRGDFVFEANYTSGLRIFDASDIDNIHEVGYIDTHPDNDARSFNGAWGVYTGLPSGNVIVSDIERGLFVVDPVATLSLAFADSTASPLDGTGQGQGAAWGDYDGDGDPDLYVTNIGPNRLYRNDGAGGFSDVTAPPLDDGDSGRGAAWADFDNDGDLDLFLVNSSAPNHLFRNDGGVFADVTEGAIGVPRTGRSAAWSDFDKDGDLDLYVANFSGSNRLFRNDGGTTFVDVTDEAGASGGDLQGGGAAWGDIDGDGDPDLYLTNFSGPNVVLRNDGGVFADVTAMSGDAGDPSRSVGTAFADYDNDGDLDLYVASRDEPNTLLRNDGGVFLDVTDDSGPVGVTGTSATVSWADLDKDGALDLFVGSTLTDCRMYRNRGDGHFHDVTLPLLGDVGAATSAAWGDYDGDGAPDLYVVRYGETNHLFRNASNPDLRWLKLHLVGVYSNASAIGARVRVVAGGLTQTRELSGGSGYLSQNEMDLLFGLGRAALVDTLEIRWPSGIRSVGTMIPTNQRLVVVEGDELPAENDGGSYIRPLAPPVARLLGATPNPFNPLTQIAYEVTAPVRVRLVVVDAGGRLVRGLLDGAALGPGRHTVRWDGRDDAGREAASGTYFYRLEAGGRADAMRLTLLR
jgi:choice-of-anchor B domain-containing protein